MWRLAELQSENGKDGGHLRSTIALVTRWMQSMTVPAFYGMASHPTVVAEGAAAIALPSKHGVRPRGPKDRRAKHQAREWLQVFMKGLAHTPYCIKAEAAPNDSVSFALPPLLL